MSIEAFLLAALVAGAPADRPPTADRGSIESPLPVQSLLLDWTDAKRNRTLPVKIYHPAEGSGPFPVIVFSHGLGGTREGYEYLGRHWAGHGYVSVHLQHPGSDDAAWRNQATPMKSMQQATADPSNAMDRPLDVRFAIDQLALLNRADGLLKGRLDLKRMGMAGHSFGAYTTMAISGQAFGLGGTQTLADDRVKAAIAMSAPVPRRNLDAAYSKIRIPLFHLTGTEDNSVIGDTTAAERRVPFDRIQGAEQFLVTFTGGDHMVFSGRSGSRGDRSKDGAFRELILRSTTAFWDAYLNGDPKAKAWLAAGGFEKALGKNGVFEKKLPAPTGRGAEKP